MLQCFIILLQAEVLDFEQKTKSQTASWRICSIWSSMLQLFILFFCFKLWRVWARFCSSTSETELALHFMMCFSAWPQKILAIEWSTVRHIPSVVRHAAWYELNSVRVGPARLWIARWAEVSFSSPVFFVFQKKGSVSSKLHPAATFLCLSFFFHCRYCLKWLWSQEDCGFNYIFLFRLLTVFSLI